MKEQLEAIRKQALESIAGTQAGAELEALRVTSAPTYFGTSQSPMNA